MTDDEPITLANACEQFPLASLSYNALMSEYRRGKLAAFKLGRSWHTTLRDMREWFDRCRDDARRPGSTLTASEGDGSSETARAFSALDAANETVKMLKQSSQPTSCESTSPPRRARR